MNPQIHKGNYVVVGIVLTDYDGNVDTTTAITVSAPSGLLVEPVASGASNRSFYVSVPSAATLSASNLIVSLAATIAATGTGVGAPPVTKNVAFTFDTVVPVDHRAAAVAPSTPTAESPLPHP